MSLSAFVLVPQVSPWVGMPFYSSRLPWLVLLAPEPCDAPDTVGADVVNAPAAPPPCASVSPSPGGSLAVYLAGATGRPRREIVTAIFSLGVPVFHFTDADVRAVLSHLGVSSA